MVGLTCSWVAAKQSAYRPQYVAVRQVASRILSFLCTRRKYPLASRLLNTGGTLKEVADVLRHRRLDTTLIYAKVDLDRLAAVTMPWPGSAA